MPNEGPFDIWYDMLPSRSEIVDMIIDNCAYVRALVYIYGRETVVRLIRLRRIHMPYRRTRQRVG